MQFLAWLESNAFSQWVLTTTWVYPWVIALHSIGMGLLVGIVSMIALRVIGIGDYAIRPLAAFLVVIRIAFALNVATGLMMFIIDAQQFYFSPTFRVKMLFVLLGIISGWLLSSRVFTAPVQADTGPLPQSTRAIAVVSLVCWAGAIFAGRMTAYLP